jgi:Flp pilus assembly protein TadD
MKNYDRAIADCNEALRVDPKHMNAFLNRGLAYAAKRNYSQAIADYDQAIRLDPKSASAFVARGKIHSEKREFAEAIADYGHAIELNPELAVAYGNRCGVRIAAGQDLHVALSDCDESLRLQPHQTAAFTHRGYIQLKLGRETQAIADFDAALSVDPKYTWAMYGRGLARWGKGDTSGAQSDVAAATKALPNVTLSVAKYYGLAPKNSLSWRLALAADKERPMLFAIAHGNSPNACGEGCNEWIAAEGFFDKDIESRFRKFLGGLHDRKLPIFFHSPGGFMNESYAIGRMLRERKMTAGIAITIPEDCHNENVADESCRHILQTGGPFNAQLRAAGAMCNSACVYAFIGAVVRQIPDGAILGVHSPLAPATEPKSRRVADAIEQQAHAKRRQYAKEMGVDPELVELADKTPYIGIHVLNRDEIAHLQIETTTPH